MIRALDGDFARTGWPAAEPGVGPGHAADAPPPGFVALPDRLPPCLDRSLGYVGSERFVIFRYEPRGEEVVWEDGHTYGFGAGGWCAFEDVVAPLAKRYAADLGNQAAAGRDVLVLDRHTSLAYFAEQGCARRFVGRLTGPGACGGGTAVASRLSGAEMDGAVDVFGRLDVDRTCS